MTDIGTPFSANADRLLLLGSGELGKEVAIEAQRFGIEVIAVDRYPNAPAMQVADRAHVINMLDGDALENVICKEQPKYIVPEIEAIATDRLLQLESKGFNVIPNARATSLTMDREGIRRFVSEKLKLPTSQFYFAATQSEYLSAVERLRLPFVIKPIMSSSGKGQSIVKQESDILPAWKVSQQEGRGKQGRVIIESFIDFDYEITLLTVRHRDGTAFCEPIGHLQVDGDYRESWQPQPMQTIVKKKSEHIAKTVTDALGGFGVFGVELFIKGNDVFFSEVSPRPHDTGMVTMISQDLSEFALHVRAILALPIPKIRFYGPSASYAIIGEGNSQTMQYCHLDRALQVPDTALRLFGKPEMNGKRRLGVVLSRDQSIDLARSKARQSADMISIKM